MNITNIVRSSATKVETRLIAFSFSLLQSGDDLFRVSTTFLVLAECLIQETFSPVWKNEFDSNTNTKKEQKTNLGGNLETKSLPEIISL